MEIFVLNIKSFKEFRLMTENSYYFSSKENFLRFLQNTKRYIFNDKDRFIYTLQTIELDTNRLIKEEKGIMKYNEDIGTIQITYKK